MSEMFRPITNCGTARTHATSTTAPRHQSCTFFVHTSISTYIAMHTCIMEYESWWYISGGGGVMVVV
eukprot:m.289427 g.289427  ORF g.289427 m.289427 type:complete len:67 (+) comp15809_c0_seq12:7795-7995(+)